MELPESESPAPQGHFTWRHPLVILTCVAVFGAIAAILVAALKPSDLILTLISNLLTFVASGLISYFITYSNERRQFNEEIGKFAAFSRRRVDLLSANLRSLNKEISLVGDEHQTRRIVSYTLNNLEQDARASVRDIEDMGGITAQSMLPNAPALVQENPKVGQLPSTERVDVLCGVCEHSNPVELGAQAGSTRSISCAKCAARINVHRLPSSMVKVVMPQTEDYSTRLERETLSRLSTDAAAAQIRGMIECPRCRNQIPYSARASDTKVQKPCFSCFPICTLDTLSGNVTVDNSRRPRYVESINVDRMDCEVCGTHFKPQKYSTSEGVSLICCFNCNTIYLNKNEQKILLTKECPSCQRGIRFKTSGQLPKARQFCLDCFVRLEYDGNTDQVAIVEELSVPALTAEAFREAGEVCPHCHQPASGRWTRNDAGRKISICWNCKGVFEILSDEPASEKGNA